MSARKAKPEPKPEYNPNLRPATPAEEVALKAARESRKRRPARASLTLKTNGGEAVAISNPYPDHAGWIDLIGETFGSSADPFVMQAFGQLSTAASSGKSKLTELEANAALALMGAIAPADELEAAMGIQVVANHTASLDFLSRARMNAGEYRDTAIAYVNAATKLSRTMAVMVEALAKLRSGGKQQVEVRYVYIDARGGQNVIGSTIQPSGGGVLDPNLRQSQALAPGLAYAPGETLPGQDPPGIPMPVTSGPRAGQVPDARRYEPGRAEGQGERPLQVGAVHEGAEGRPSAGQGSGEAGEGDA